MSKTFYAVQHGDYFASDIGSTRKREAYQIARASTRNTRMKKSAFLFAHWMMIFAGKKSFFLKALDNIT